MGLHGDGEAEAIHIRQITDTTSMNLISPAAICDYFMTIGTKTGITAYKMTKIDTKSQLNDLQLVISYRVTNQENAGNEHGEYQFL